MDKPFWLLVAVLGLLVFAGIGEMLWHRGNLRAIKFRVHVNGTRGKSSVTRLVAAGLRAGGIRTCAKTTGTLPRMILPDGTEFPVFRPARANIIEQIRIVAAARAQKADALVIECMALVPYLQWLSEARIVHATHAVITNARADHLDVMGPTEEDVALALAGMIPIKGRLFTAERKHLETFRACCSDRKTELIATGDADVEKISEDDLAGFKYVEHAENLALALRVCESLGVDRATALSGMWLASPDPGVLSEHRLDFFGRKIVFVNGFAANDPESSERIWNMARARHPGVKRQITLFNCRADRPDRTRQLARASIEWEPSDRTVLMGTGTYLFAREIAKASREVSTAHFVFVEGRGVDEIFEAIVSQVEDSALVMGLGNIGGQGLELVQYFRNRSIPTETP